MQCVGVVACRCETFSATRSPGQTPGRFIVIARPIHRPTGSSEVVISIFDFVNSAELRDVGRQGENAHTVMLVKGDGCVCKQLYFEG